MANRGKEPTDMLNFRSCLRISWAIDQRELSRRRGRLIRDSGPRLGHRIWVPDHTPAAAAALLGYARHFDLDDGELYHNGMLRRSG